MDGAEDLRDRVLEDLLKHTAGRSPTDDVTLIIVKILGKPVRKCGLHA
jgi:serine phosphatase RsbU (regulator of sigma subunit)